MLRDTRVWARHVADSLSRIAVSVIPNCAAQVQGDVGLGVWVVWVVWVVWGVRVIWVVLGGFGVWVVWGLGCFEYGGLGFCFFWFWALGFKVQGSGMMV